ncbi:MAG: hypothetical protein R3F60_04600 [bacterium]
MRRATWWVWAVLALGAGCDSGDGGAVMEDATPGRRGGCPPDGRLDAEADAAARDAGPSEDGAVADGGRPDADLVDAAPPTPQCADGVDNDADGHVDLADRGCRDAADDDESDEIPCRSATTPRTTTGTAWLIWRTPTARGRPIRGRWAATPSPSARTVRTTTAMG